MASDWLVIDNRRRRFHCIQLSLISAQDGGTSQYDATLDIA